MRPDALIIALATALVGPAAAQVPVAVRARAAFDDVQARAAGLRVSVRGVLRDDLGRPVPGAPVQVGRDAARTGPRGRFQVVLEVARDGLHRVPVAYAGSSLLGPAAHTATVTVGRRAVQLRAEPVGEVPAGRPVSWTASLTDGAGQPEAAARLDWRLDDGPWQGAQTDARGRAQLAHAPLSPGVHTLEVAFAGDADRLPARWARGLEATRPMGISLERAAGDGIRVVGQVQPGPGVAQVVLTVDGQPVARRVTGRDGRWALTVDGLAPGARRLRAIAETSVPGWADAASKALVVTIPTPPPPSPAWLWLPAGLGLAAVGWLAWRRRPARPIATPKPPAREPAVAALRPVTGSQPDLQGLTVTLVDAVSGVPLAGRLAGLGRPHPALDEQPPDFRAAHAGQPVALDPPPAWVWGSASGYAPACLPVTAPGALELALLPAAAWVQQRFDHLLAAAGRPRLAFGAETPREAARALAARGAPEDPLWALVAAVEAACFAPESPLDLHQLAGMAAAVEAGLHP